VAASIALIGCVLLKKVEAYEEPSAPKDGQNRGSGSHGQQQQFNNNSVCVLEAMTSS
jgi:hypothetical protein